MNTVLIALILLATQVAPPATQPPAAPPAAATGAEDYAVGVGDVLSLKVFGEDDATRESLPIDPDGTVEVPHLGRIAVVGKTVRQIQEYVEALYVKNKVYTNPSVAVGIREYRSQTVYVMGPGVKAPQQVTLRGSVSVIDALSQAGWFSDDAGAEVHVYRHRATDPPNVAVPLERTPDLKLNRKDVVEGRALNVRVGPGDTIYVPAADVFYVTGQVKNPNTYTLRPGLTVWQAVSAMAGGITERGAKGRIYITRTVNGKETRIKVKNINTHIVQPNDTIVVPNRRW